MTPEPRGVVAAPRILAAGDNVVDCYEQSDVMYPGGNCVNVSVFARRFGARASYLGQVGRDAAGRCIARALAAEGVGLERFREVSGATAHCLIGLRDGERVFLDSAKGVSVFEPNLDDLAAVEDADAVHVGATSDLDAWVPEFAHRARLSYDFTTFRDPEHIARIAPHAFLVTFSGGDLDDDGAMRLASDAVTHGAAWALVTRGERGALLTDGRDTWTAAAAPVTVVDTLGAGDTFISRTLVGLLRGERPDRLLVAAAAAAAETCRSHGAFGYPEPTAIGSPAAAIDPRPERDGSLTTIDEGEHV